MWISLTGNGHTEADMCAGGVPLCHGTALVAVG